MGLSLHTGSDRQDHRHQTDCLAPPQLISQQAHHRIGEGGRKGDAITLSVSQAEQLYQAKVTISALQATTEQLHTVGALRGIQCIEAELRKEKRRERELVKESPAVADAFLKRHKAEEQYDLARKRTSAQLQQQQQREAATAIAKRTRLEPW